ncbi:MAG TPA: hypothetical protein VKR52_10605 [Terracidiphilus sp.]|nr:hypothetical protein [Terracidiphilus sp.]
MAGYSGTPLLKKLGIKEGHRVLLRNAPAALPDELKQYRTGRPSKDLDVALLFAKSRAEFRADYLELIKAIKADGMIWVAWPKRTSGVNTDLTENLIRDEALKTPLVDVKVCAIDDTWSGLKLVVRKEYRTAFAMTATN